MAWLRIPATDTSYRRIIHTHFLQSASTDSLQLAKLNSNKLLIARGDSTGSGYGVTSDAALVADTWYHVIAHGGLSINPKLWIDGVAQSGSSTTALGIGSQNARLYLGMRSAEDAAFKGDIGDVNYWLSNSASEVPAPTDQEAMMLYRSQNPWSWNPDQLKVVSPLRSLDQPAIYLGTSVGSAVKVGSPTQSDEHSPLISSDMSVISEAAAGSSVSVTPGAASLAYTGYAPTVTAVNSKVFTGTIDLKPIDVSGVIATRIIAMGEISLAPIGISGNIIEGSNNQLVSPAAASLAYTGYAPTVTASDHQSFEVPVGSLSYTGYAPALTITGNVNIGVPIGGLTYTGYAPSIEIASSVLLTVPTGGLQYAGYSPDVTIEPKRNIGFYGHKECPNNNTTKGLGFWNE